MRNVRHAIVKNGTELVASFGSHILAEEAFYDLGCYLDESPTPDDQFEIVPEVEFRKRQLQGMK